MQQTFTDFSAFDMFIDKKTLLVCDNAFDLFGIKLPFDFVRFSDFKSNPLFEDAIAGAEVFRQNKCDSIVAIGGGSSIDTAKCVKYLSHSDAPIMAVPTTSGTGSEATHFAAIYRGGEKHSIADEKLTPDYVILQPDTLNTLPVYQKKCTMMDALCQAIESWWSKKATSESIGYSRQAIGLILANMERYLANEAECNRNMMAASNLAGKAINITTTTAPHAMSYKLTTLYGLPHGHAVALCLPKVWRYMGNFVDIAQALGKRDSNEAVMWFELLLKSMEIMPPENASADDLETLVNSVNAQRLGNNPLRLEKDAIKAIYKETLEV